MLLKMFFYPKDVRINTVIVAQGKIYKKKPYAYAGRKVLKKIIKGNPCLQLLTTTMK